jgi:hypothetical protein
MTSRVRRVLQGWNGPRSAQLELESVPPPAWMLDMRCTSCGEITAMLRGDIRGPRVRRCDACQAKVTA